MRAGALIRRVARRRDMANFAQRIAGIVKFSNRTNH
jgi:hypothetical protein